VSVLEIASHGAELLDDPGASPPSVRESLRNIARANRWLGGASALRYALRQALRDAGDGPLTLLDVGTGTGDLPRMASDWAARHGVTLLPIGLELSGVAARMARANGLASLVGDGGVLPLRDRSMDLVMLSQVAHHFSPAGIVRLLSECGRVARRAVIVCDLRRAPLARWSFPLAGWVLRFDRHTVRDGVTSLRRGFTSHGLASMLSRAGLSARVVRRPGARLVAVATIGYAHR
jgi:ubiquinone/menaquinone biosynthesis C-methylase UbiE